MTAPTHLVVAVHGFVATPATMDALVSAMRTAHPPGSGVLVHASTANAGALQGLFSTTRGVADGGVRLAAEVRQLAAQHPTLTKLSFLAVSLGGLYARSAAGELYAGDDAFARRLRPANLITFASPWAGARRNAWDAALRGGLAMAMGAGFFGATGRHLVLSDADGAGGVPLLAWMADPRSPAGAATAAFAHRVLLANVRADDKVPFWSAALADAPPGDSEGGGQGGEGGRRLAAVATVHFRRRGGGGTGGATAGDDGRPPHFVARDGSLVDMAPFPHVAAVYSSDCTGAAPVNASGAQDSADGISADNASGGAAAAAWGTDASGPGLAERAIVARLRAYLPFMNIDVDFPELGGWLLNHLRIAQSRPGLTGVGADVVDFVARHVFQR